MENAKIKLLGFYNDLTYYGFTEIKKGNSLSRNEFAEGTFVIKNSLGQTITFSASTICLNIRISFDNIKEHDSLYHASMYDISGMFICLDNLYIKINNDNIFNVYIGKEN